MKLRTALFAIATALTLSACLPPPFLDGGHGGGGGGDRGGDRGGDGGGDRGGGRDGGPR
ncbi:MAG: hypothetical protein QM581_00010 [Pseudomonas sp.]